MQSQSNPSLPRPNESQNTNQTQSQTQMHVQNEDEPKKWGDTTSKQGETSRVFMGSIDAKTTTCFDIEKKFAQYGLVQGVDINSAGFAFIQFNSVEEANKACQMENGTIFKGKKVEVRLFEKSNHAMKGKPPGGFAGPTGPIPGPYPRRDRSRSPIGTAGGYPSPGGSMGRPLGPPMGPPMRGGGNNSGRRLGGPTGSRHGAPLPPSSYYDYDDYAYPPAHPAHPAHPSHPVAPPIPHIPPGVPAGPLTEPPPIGNDAEIIVISKEQWGYAEMIESRVRYETGIEYIDMLFLHSPTSLNVTLNDLYERQTLYAIVVGAANEEHKSLTLHVLHDQTEHRNMPLDDAVSLIRRDFHAFLTRKGITPPPIPPPSWRGPPPAGSLPAQQAPPGSNGSTRAIGVNQVHSDAYQTQAHPQTHANMSNPNANPNRPPLPDEIAFLLRTVIQENGVQFLSLPQVDSLVQYFTRERQRLSNRGGSGDAIGMGSSGVGNSGQSSEQSSAVSNNPLSDPHVKAALSSLLQLGVIDSVTSGSSGGNGSGRDSSGYGGSYSGVSSGNVGSSGSQSASPRRHPLLGTEIAHSLNETRNSAANNSGCSGSSSVGLVKYPPPMRY